MKHDLERDQHAEAFDAFGWTLLTDLVRFEVGFPLFSRSSNGDEVLVTVPTPPLLDRLDRDRVGLVLVDETGTVRSLWGLAEDVRLFQDKDLTTEPRLIGLLQAAYRGQTGSVHMDSWRFVTGPTEVGDQDWALILVLDAKEEAESKRRAQLSERKAEALKKIGKALTMHQTLQPMVVAASHAIAAATELAAVLLWVRNTDDGPMELSASVGANRSGTATLAKIDTERGVSCAAELSAVRRKPLILPSVKDNPMTSELEAKFCYLAPGGVMVWPLTIGSRLVGMLEVVSREDDATFLEGEDLFSTIAEHLSLALNSALMFESVEKLAAFDPLTGIANHRTMQEFLHRRINESSRSDGTVGVIMLDVDHFRVFNEEEGHDAGDKVLKMVTEVLKACVRPYDLAARYGGEEFTVIMPGVSKEGTLAIAERIRNGIEQLEYVSSAGVQKHITASLGCSMYPVNATDSASLLKAADMALYEAKRTTRNRTVMHEGELRNERTSDNKVLLFAARDMIPETFREETEPFLKASRPYLAHVGEALRLSANQIQTLEAAALLVPFWSRLRARGDLVTIHQIESKPELKTVVSSLMDLDERFDGEGPKGLSGPEIPQLTRVLSVLKAVVQGDMESLESDPHRFDPDILNVFSEYEKAA